MAPMSSSWRKISLFLSAAPKTVTIGGRDYYLLQCTAGEGTLGQDFLFTRIGNHMVSVILSYSPVLVDNADMLAMLGIK